MELLVAFIIFALILGGLANIFVAGKRYILHARARMAGGELGKAFLDPLQSFVRADTWNATGNDLVPGEYSCVNMSSCINQTRTFTNIPYDATYNITNVEPSYNDTIRRVQVTINWTEPKP